METRSRRIVTLAQTAQIEKDRKLLDDLVSTPYYESTKGTDSSERNKAILGYRSLSPKHGALVASLESSLVYPIRTRASDNSNDFLNINVPMVTTSDDIVNETDSIPEPFSDSGSEYVPSVVSSSSSNELSDRHADFDIELKKQPAIVYTNTDKISEISNTVSADSFLSENVEFPQESNRSVTAAMKLNGKRIRNKGHSCYFCQKLVVNNLARHFELNHGKEMEVARILAKPKNSKDRRDGFLNLSRCGDFYHNCDTLVVKKGELILTRRPTLNEIKYSSYTDYGPCPECLGFMLKKHIWHHLKYSCKSKMDKSDESNTQIRKMPIAESSALLNGILGTNVSTEFLNNIINKFKNDAISQSCKEDNTIIKFGAFLYEKYDATQSELIRQSMRQLGRLTMQLRKLDEGISVLKDALVPGKFDVIVNATKQLCVATKEIAKRPEFGIPSLALKIGYALRKCISIERGQALRAGDLKSNEQFISFLTLLDLEWSVRISSNALATLYSRKKTAIDLLPITSDLVKLSNFIDKEINQIKKEIGTITSAKWTKLASLTLSRIILFNKRRSGEAAKITMTDYASRPVWDSTGTEEMKNSLTTFENKLASKLTIVRITGKRGRIVPVILTTDMKESIDVLILNRVKCGISNENPYIFALATTTTSHLRGHDCLKKWCLEAELQSPDLVTSTKLRKYVATVCQIFNLSENEYDWLARHLGHDVRVHREFYRLQENAVELTKISRILLAVDQGEAHKYSGQELKDINIEDLPNVEENEGDEEDEEEITIEESMQTESNTSERAKLSQTLNPFQSLEDNLPSDKESLPLQKTAKGKRAKKRKDKDGSRDYSGRKPWSSQEKALILKEFKILIKSNNLPGKRACTELMEKKPIFAQRKWTDLKYFMKNHLSNINKKTTLFQKGSTKLLS